MFTSDFDCCFSITKGPSIEYIFVPKALCFQKLLDEEPSLPLLLWMNLFVHENKTTQFTHENTASWLYCQLLTLLSNKKQQPWKQIYYIVSSCFVWPQVSECHFISFYFSKLDKFVYTTYWLAFSAMLSVTSSLVQMKDGCSVLPNTKKSLVML